MIAIHTQGMSRAEFALAVFLQGGVNKTGKNLILDIDNYMEYVTEPAESLTLSEAVRRFAPGFDGIAVFDLGTSDVGINLAATACAVENWLGVPRSLLSLVPEIPVCFDAGDYRGTRTERQNAVFERYRDRLNPTGLVHQVVLGDDYHLQLRDLAIAKGYFTFFTDETPEDLAFRSKVLTWANRNIPVYGWTADEISFVRSISAFGNYVIPMDWSSNHSYFGMEPGRTVRQKIRGGEPLTPGKHYLAIVVSDGDNIQWLERDFSTTSTYGQRIRRNCGYKMNWTMSPSMATLCPEVLEKLYAQANNDYFITGVSGVGYNNLMTYPREHLKAYAALTADAMKASDLRCMCMLDNLDTAADEREVRERLDIFTAYPEIEGGIWEMDPDRYESGRGRVYWSSDGKPFVSVRLSLWHPSNDPRQVTREWLDGYAEKLNAMPVCPDRIDGYTVLNVHPWTVNMEELDYLMSRLDSHIKTVYVTDFLRQIRERVPHVNALPGQNTADAPQRK